jgi:GAF domain-containing protein
VSEPAPDAIAAALRAIAIRAEAARRLAPTSGAAVLRSIVDATVALFDAEAASIALYEPATEQLVFRVAAGDRGQGVVGLAIGSSEGIAGYVFSTGQPIALSDVARDARFGREAAESTGYVPRSIVAVPLLDDDGSVGVLEVLDRRGDGGFDLRDVELASIFARQATVAIRASRIERDTSALLGEVLGRLVTEDAVAAEDVEAIVRTATAGLDDEDDRALWAIADAIGRVRNAGAGELSLARDILEVLARRAERR